MTTKIAIASLAAAITLDELTTLLWTPEMGKRLAAARMRLLLDQGGLAVQLGVTQAAVSRIELGHTTACDRITVADLKRVFPSAFNFIVFAQNAKMYEWEEVSRIYWKTVTKNTQRSRQEKRPKRWF